MREKRDNLLWKEEQINKLKEEFNSIDGSDKNTIYREKILNIIGQLYKLKNDIDNDSKRQELIITNIIKTNILEAKVFFKIGDSLESYINIVELNGNFSKERMLYLVRNLIIDGKAIIHKLPYTETGSKEWYKQNVEKYNGNLTNIQVNVLGKLSLEINCDNVLIDNLKNFLDDIYIIGTKYNITLNFNTDDLIKEELIWKLKEFRNNDIINNLKYDSENYSNVKFEIN